MIFLFGFEENLSIVFYIYSCSITYNLTIPDLIRVTEFPMHKNIVNALLFNSDCDT